MGNAVPLDDLPVTVSRSLPYNSPTLDLHAARLEDQYGLPTGILRSIKNDGEKSNGGQVSPKGARGVMQFMPDTAKEYGLKDPTDPLEAMDAAARYLVKAQQVTGSNDPAILAAAYNGGMNRQVLKQGAVPNIPETKAYASRVQNGIGKYAATASKLVPDDDLPDMPKQAAAPATPAGGGYWADRMAELPQIGGQVRDAAAGFVRGAGSIGSTLIDAARSLGADVTNAVPANMRPSVTAGLQGPVNRGEMDAGLQSLGADPNSTAYAGGKSGAEVAGTLGVGGALAKPIAAVLPRLAQALTTGGMSTGASVAPGMAAKAADMGVRMVGGAGNAAAASTLIDPNLKSAGVSAAVGAALPPVAKGVGVVGNALGSAFFPSMARGKAVNKIAETLGSEGKVSQAVGDMQTYYPKGAENIPVSAAGITKNADLARLEQGSRIKNSPAWYDFDQAQGKAVFDNVMKATGEADDLGSRLAQRSANWTEAWQKASDAQKPRIWVKRMGQLGGDLDQALASPESSNPAVRQVLQAVRDEVVRVGPGFSPGHLQQLRANLNGKINPMSPDVFKSAPRDNPAIITLKQEMDDILNSSTGGKWQKVIEGYAEDSTAVHASKAAAKVRGSFMDGETGRVKGISLDPMGDVPKVTEAGIGRAMDAARLPDKSLALSTGAEQRLSATLDALRRQNIVQGVKRAATAGGGSDTIPNAVAAGVHSAGAPNMLLQLMGAVKKMGTGKTDNALAQLLSNPDELVKALNAYMAPQSANRLGSLALRSAPIVSGQIGRGQ